MQTLSHVTQPDSDVVTFVNNMLARDVKALPRIRTYHEHGDDDLDDVDDDYEDESRPRIIVMLFFAVRSIALVLVLQ